MLARVRENIRYIYPWHAHRFQKDMSVCVIRRKSIIRVDGTFFNPAHSIYPPKRLYDGFELLGANTINTVFP